MVPFVLRLFVDAVRLFNVLSLLPASAVSLQNCTNVSCLRITCLIGRLDRRQSAVVKIRSRLWVQTFLQVRLFLPSHSPSISVFFTDIMII